MTKKHTNLKTIKIDEMERVIEEHILYILTFLDTHSTDHNTRRVVEFHYRTAFQHGWKHGVEYAQSNRVNS